MELRNFDHLDYHFENLYVNYENKKINGEVFTPPSLINEMISEVLQLDQNLFKNPEVKILEPASGIGNYTFYLFKHLYYDLVDAIPDSQTRIDHIIKNCLYLIETNKESVEKCKNIFKEVSDVPLNIIVGDALSSIFPFKFDLIIGNPPYNKPFIRNTYGPSFYHLFILYYLDRCRILSFITPSRWLKSNKQFDEIRRKVFNRKDLVSIKHFDYACDVFKTKSIKISGGVSYFIKDSKYSGFCNYNGTIIDLSLFDILVNSKDIPLINAIRDYPKLSDIHISSKYYYIETNDSRCHLKKKNGDILCHMSNKKGTYAYIDPSKLDRESDDIIVIFNRISNDLKFKNLRIKKKGEVFSSSFNGLRVNNLVEAQSLVSYLQTNFACKLLSLRKMTNGFSKKTIEWIIRPPLDRHWTDENLKKYYIELNEYDFNFS